MLLLIADSCLLFFITYFTGILAENMVKKFLRVELTFNFFETFVLGLITCYVYFNLLSFFAPVNYFTLLPLLLISTGCFLRKATRQRFFSAMGGAKQFFFSRQNLPFIIPFILLLFVYWIIPPLNWDSGEYHYIAIRWYEQFKIVPGLANVHGRLAFNPANFIISAAYSFTDLAGQALYPLNGVVTLLFYAWLVKKILAPTRTLYNFILLATAILLFRITIINLSSPSSDLLSGVLLLYCGLRTYELIKADKNAFGDYLPVLIISCFSITAKLSALPSLLIIPFIFFTVIKSNKRGILALKSIALAALIVLPWLIRNVLLSGYLLYPVPGTNFFNADWAVPADVVKLDYIFSRYGPRTVTVDFVTMQQMNLVQLSKTWFQYMAANDVLLLLLFLLSAFSPMLWLFLWLKKKSIPAKITMLWCVYYLGVAVWFINSPEGRFGISYILLAVSLPFLECQLPQFNNWRIYRTVLSAVISICLIYYSLSLPKKTGFYRFSVTDCWLKPLRDYRYFQNNDLQSFPAIPLGNGVNLYLPDKTHACLNVNGPCMGWRYGEIEMRGNKMEDGFRNKKDEVKKYYPFVSGGK